MTHQASIWRWETAQYLVPPLALAVRRVMQAETAFRALWHDVRESARRRTVSGPLFLYVFYTGAE